MALLAVHCIGLRRREQILDAATAVFAEHGYARRLRSHHRRSCRGLAGLPAPALRQQGGAADGGPGGLGPSHRRGPPHRPTGLDYFRRLPEVMEANLATRGLLELVSTIAAEVSSPSHPAREFIQQRYTDNIATLARHLQQAVDAGDVAPLSPAQIDVEVRLVTAVLDGIGLQWLLDSSTDVVESISTYVDRTILGWRSSR